MDDRDSTRGEVSRAARSVAAVRALPWTTILLVLVIGVASWPVAYGPARIGVDPSWGAALGYALEHGEHFGRDIVWTYGPLGFLAIGWPWYGPITLLALAFIGAVHFALCAVIVVGARHVVPAWHAAAIGYLAARVLIVVPAYEALLILVFAGCAALLLRRKGPPANWVVLVGGIVAAVGILGKLNVGIFIGAMVLVTTVALVRPWWRGILILLASGGIACLVLWLATGQRLADLGAYAAGSYEIIRGYSQAMGVDQNANLHWFLPAYLLGVLLVARIAAHEAEDRPRAKWMGLALVGAIVAFAYFKSGFVRLSLGYGLAYAIGAVVVAFFALVRERTSRSLFLTTFVAVLLPAIATWGDPIAFVNPVSSLRSLYHEATTMLRPWTWATAEATTRAQLQKSYALEPSILDALHGHTVEIDPWQTAVIAAWPDLTWQPLPVFQSYSAYTPALDALNAAVLRGPNAPQRILRETAAVLPGGKTMIPVSIDHRNRWFDAPEAMLETFCRYDEVAASVRWEVLALSPRECGTPEPLRTVVARPGQVVVVPVETRPDRFVIVRVHGVDDSLLDRLISTIYKSPEWYITLDGSAPYRLVPGTAVDGLLMAVPSSIDRSSGFTFGPAVRQLSIEPRTPSKGAGVLTFEFLSVPLVGP